MRRKFLFIIVILCIVVEPLQRSFDFGKWGIQSVIDKIAFLNPLRECIAVRLADFCDDVAEKDVRLLPGLSHPHHQFR